ncbi:MAG: class I SAM-dependent methyltransferase [Ruminococcus sp.]|nr:class I SAM-dependent methyltransferase [Ruminococcus sp.]
MEKMTEFFAARVGDYDEHMLNEVEGCREGYIKMAELLPENTETLLDLGCGTGLELEEIFRRFPKISVTGIDLTREMLDKAKDKFKDKSITLINSDYFKADLGSERFDTAISFQTMHHFERERKISLYKKIYCCLKNGGVYIECDYMTETTNEEERLFGEYDRIRREMNIPEGEYYHFDIPCTASNQMKMLTEAGFSDIKQVFRIGNTTIITAEKE